MVCVFTCVSQAPNSRVPQTLFMLVPKASSSLRHFIYPGHLYPPINDTTIPSVVEARDLGSLLISQKPFTMSVASACSISVFSALFTIPPTLPTFMPIISLDSPLLLLLKALSAVRSSLSCLSLFCCLASFSKNTS